MCIDKDTIEIRPGESFDSRKVEQCLREHIAGLSDDQLLVRQFPAGASNLTYLLRIGNWEGVLRRPPLGPVAPKAHDMERECRLLQKIHPVFPLAPRPYFCSSDQSTIGAPFYVMERRKGFVINDGFPAGIDPTPELCRRISHTVVDTLVQIHRIDWQAAGLGSLGHPDGFLARQVRGWIERYSRARTDEIPQVEFLVRWLSERVPVSPPPTLIHNDFKLNNMLLDRHDLAKVIAVLDWEMATIGDPLFDLAVTLSYWVNKNDPEELQTVLPAVTSLPGFLDREQFMQRYSQQSGRDLSSLHFYMAFAYFKLAVIIQQIYVRWKRGQTQDERFATFGTRVRSIIDYAAQVAASHRA
ncbi:MAG: phosphotransferase family protein [Ktedonobacteraceae bacterium]|nr:phosphotransferase family protein [Ktedonobacteraceae bacterium]